MAKSKLLTEREVSQLMPLLSEEQQEFIERNSKQSKKAKWLEALAKFKGIDVREDMTVEEIEAYIDDWVLIDILDCGYGNRDYKCHCGTTLRYQYIVLNKTRQKTFGFGETCLSNHTSLSAELVKDILNGFHKIDLVRDEILIKVFKEEPFDFQPYQHLDNIPTLILEQVNVGLPLLDKQIYQLEKLKQEYDQRKRIEGILDSMKEETRKVFEGFPEPIQEDLLEKMEQEDYVQSLPEGFHDNDIEWLISLGLPILDRHQEKIFAFISKQNLEKRIQKQREEALYYASLREKVNSIQNQKAALTRPVSELDYNTLMERHKPTLKAVHQNSARLTRTNEVEWQNVIRAVNQLKEGGEFDYYNFKNSMTMICIQLGIARDIFLIK